MGKKRFTFIDESSSLHVVITSSTRGYKGEKTEYRGGTSGDPDNAPREHPRQYHDKHRRTETWSGIEGVCWQTLPAADRGQLVVCSDGSTTKRAILHHAGRHADIRRSGCRLPRLQGQQPRPRDTITW
jgi:hypothetical protein